MKGKTEFYDKINVNRMMDFEKRRVEKMISILKDVKFSNFIDLGCLPSLTEYFAKKFNCEGIGVNISKKVIRNLREKSGRVKYIVGDVEQLNFKKKFDLVICGELIEHILNVDDFIKKIRNMMHKKSFLLLTTPNLASFLNRIFLLLGWQPRGINPSRKVLLNPLTRYDYNWGHVSMFTYYALKKFLIVYGFKILKVEGIFGGHEGEHKLIRFMRFMLSVIPNFAENVIVLAKISGRV